MCSYCQSFDHDVNSYPYYDVFDEPYARLNAMIETLNDQHTHFVREIMEFDLLSEIDLNLRSSRLDGSLYNGCESSLFPRVQFC